MLRFLKIFVALIASCLPALAQTPVKQSSTVTPTHATCWTTNGIVQDCGTAAIPYLTTLGTVYNGDSICAWSALSTQAGSQKICLGATTAGGADISVQNYGTAPAKNLTLNLNGTAYQFPFSTSGVIGPNPTVVGGVAVWNNTIGTLLADGAANDGYFGSGRPWCDVRAKGAKGDGITDDTAAFTACVTTLNPTGGVLYVPPGNYCLFSGLSITGTTAIAITGAHRSTEIQTCGHDVTLVSLDNSAHEILSIAAVGSQTVGTTNDTISIGSNCTECQIYHVTGANGRYVANIAGVDVRIRDVRFTQAYGAAVLYGTGAWSCDACKLDTGYPVSTPSAGTNRTAWTNGHSYSLGDVVTSGSYVWQAANAGTSGGSAPSTQPFGIYIQDNVTGSCPSPSVGVCWLLVGSNNNAAAQIDTGSSTVVFSNRSDMSGAYSYGLNISGTGQSVSVTNTTFSAYQYGIYDHATVGGLTVMGSQVNGMVATTALGIYARDSDSIIANSTLIGPFADGIVVDVGKNYTIVSNSIYAATSAAIFVGGTVTETSIIGNLCGASASWGTNNVCVQLGASTVDYTTVLSNQCQGASTCISNSSTGTHNLIETTPGIVNGLSSITGGTGVASTTTLKSTSNVSPSGDSVTVQGSTITLQGFTGGSTALNCGVASSIGCIFNIAGNSSGSTALEASSAASGTVTLPAATDTLVGKATTDTLTNKTLASSTDVLGGVTTTLGSDATGDIYYRNSGGVLTRLPIGSNTNALVVSGGLPAWSTAVGGAMTYLCTITASNSATLTNASPTSGTCPINSSYTSYRLVLQQIVPATNEKILQLQIHSGGVYKSTGYLSQAYAQAGSTITGGVLTTGIPISYPADANGNSLGNAAPGLSGEVTLYSPSANAITITNVMTGYLAGGGQVDVTQGSGFWNTAGVIDGFQVLMDSGNITSGSILVYGIQ